MYTYSSKAGPVLIYSWGTSSAWLEKAAKLKTQHLVVFGVSRAVGGGGGIAEATRVLMDHGRERAVLVKKKKT